jgi:hypothetical protein
MIFDPILDLFRGKAITIPPLDGAFRPDTRLDDLPVHAGLPAPDNLVWSEGRLLASTGAMVVAPGRTDRPVAEFPAEITAMAVAPDGRLAVATDDGRLSLGGGDLPLPGGVSCVTALAFGPDGALWLANGSARHPASGWVPDLMEKGASGSVWRWAAGSGFTEVARGLGWPCGVLPDASGVVVAESWRHRLIRLESGRITPVLSGLPAYPARLVRAADGGVWLALFAPRTRLVEFVLQEHAYRRDMMAEVPREFWIAPALASGHRFLEPLQCGGIRAMGIHKAWSPSRSWGLVAKLDARLHPVESLHSRANGRRHGVTSVLDTPEGLFIASKGGDAVLCHKEARA